MPSGTGGRLSSTFCLTPPSPGAPGLCSQGLGTCLSLVRRANKSSWPTSSGLTVSHFKIKIINTETYRGWKVKGEISGIRDEAQGLTQHRAAVTQQPAKGVSVGRTQTSTRAGTVRAGRGEVTRAGLAWFLVCCGGRGEQAACCLPTQLMIPCCVSTTPPNWSPC